MSKAKKSRRDLDEVLSCLADHEGRISIGIANLNAQLVRRLVDVLRSDSHLRLRGDVQEMLTQLELSPPKEADTFRSGFWRGKTHALAWVLGADVTEDMKASFDFKAWQEVIDHRLGLDTEDEV